MACRLVLVLFLVVAALALAGCGHKASDTDCAFILDRNVEVQMKSMHITDPVAIDKRKNEIQAELKGQLQGCIGKRITDGMMACVARAQTAEAIDSCMR
jgi:outer membrane lipoprotein SlyB